MVLVVGIMVFALATIVVLAVALIMKTERQVMLDRVHRYGYEEVSEASVLTDDLTPPFSERIIRPALQRIGQMRGSMTRQEMSDATRRRLESAGRPHNLSPMEFSALKGIGCVVMLLASIGITSVTEYGRSQEILVVLVLTSLGYYMPEKWLSGKIVARKNEIQRSLPNTIDLLNVSIEAGLGFDAAIARIVEKTTGPLADEFGRALQEMRMGKARVDALRSMAHRADVPELVGLVAAVYQAEELGASLTKVLRVQGEMIRSKRRMRAREVAAKLPVKMLFPLVFFIFPSIFIVILGPGAIQISKTMLGK